MIYSLRKLKTCAQSQRAQNMSQLRFRKKANGFIPKKLKIFPVLHTV